MAEINEAELQNQYNKAKFLMNSIDCLTKNSDKAKTLKRAAKRFEALGGYADSADLAAKCKAEAEKYSNMEDNLPPAPKNPLDEKKVSKVGVWVLRIAVFLVIVGIIGFFYTRKTDHGAYLRSSFYENIGNHEKAYKMFLHLKDYKDSEDRYLKNRYKFGCELLKEKHYWDARNTLRPIRDYKDSGKKLADAEIELLKKTKVNGDILFGEAHWVVAKKTKTKAFLIKTKPVEGVPYNDKDEDVTWENSSIRSYLNSVFTAETFTPGMIDKIIDTDVHVSGNKKNNTKGSDTTDKVFMLKSSQAKHYEKQLSLFLRDYWLIEPGETQREAQFVSFGKVKAAGYPVNDKNMNARPCIWVSMK
ncbi:MAG: hypothetical protein J6W35_00885 [Eubacterium sp.]|nr:hypothetical protein [Eubacterium sp.]